MTRDLYLAIDVGTGGLRAALVNTCGKVVAFSHREHEQIVPRHGWSEQRPADWWAGTLASVKAVLSNVEDAPLRVAAIASCGQMHGSVLIDDDGRLTRETALLWNDKRTQPQVDRFAAKVPPDRYLPISANMPATSWPAFKVRWIAENDPEAFARSTTLLMPKDWINFCLTGVRGQDVTEASLSFLMDCRDRRWSDELCDITGVPRSLLPPLHASADILGGLLPEVAHDLGLPSGLPVLVGAGDYPMALLGSGVVRPQMGSDVTGTSTIITLLLDDAVIDPSISNVLTPNGVWGAMTLLDAGGDAVRWARRAFHDNEKTYGEVAKAAERAAPGSGGLFFLPYLSGERTAEKPNARAQYFGLTAAHGNAELHRAVLEGVAFSVRLRLDALQQKHVRPDRIVAAGGGAKSALWLKIKASMYRVPYVVSQELECGIVGAAILMAAATGAEASIERATERMVRFTNTIEPEPEWADLYDKMVQTYEGLYESAKVFYDELDRY